MKYSEFKEVMSDYMSYIDACDKLSDDYKLNIYETPFGEIPIKIFNKYLESNFTEDQVDDIDWWLYEKRNNPDLKYCIYDEEVPSNTLRDLWNIICRKQD